MSRGKLSTLLSVIRQGWSQGSDMTPRTLVSGAREGARREGLEIVRIVRDRKAKNKHMD